MDSKNLICIKAILESEQRRIKTMLKQMDKVKDTDDLALIEQGFELSEHYMNAGRSLCKEVME